MPWTGVEGDQSLCLAWARESKVLCPVCSCMVVVGRLAMVQAWNARGYAAISIAVEGQTDLRDAGASPDCPWQQHEWTGPGARVSTRMDLPFTEQWMYHAVADAILANSLLRSLPAVDAERVGVMAFPGEG